MGQLEELLDETMPTLIREARAAFRRDLPRLLQRHAGRWVAYSGEQQLTIGPSKTSVYQDCLRRGLKRDQFLVLLIEPESRFDSDVDLPLNV